MFRISAVIFDMDGVLIDSEPLHLEAANELLGRYGHQLTAAENEAFLGSNETVYWTALSERFGLPDPVPELIAARHLILVRMLRDRLPLMPGVVPFLEALRAKALPLAVASSSERELIDHVLDHGGLARFFDVVASGDEVERPKPDPEIFLLAARRLGRRPEDCLVFEDSVNGVRAAQAAGMPCVRVVTDVTRNLRFPEVGLVVDGFKGVGVDMVIDREGSGL